MTNKEFGMFLRKAIIDSGLQIRQLSRMSGVSEEAIHSWMRCSTSPRLEMMSDVLKVLGYKVEVVKCNR